MSNGSAALASSPLPGPPAPDSSRQAPERSIELEIGEAAVDACKVLAVAMLEFHQNDQMTPATKLAGAEKIAKLAQLELDTLGEIDNFADVARKEGKTRLREILDTDPDFCRQRGANARDATLTVIIDGVLEISQRVVALEKSLRAN